jgi:hypothetical protein
VKVHHGPRLEKNWPSKISTNWPFTSSLASLSCPRCSCRSRQALRRTPALDLATRRPGIRVAEWSSPGAMSSTRDTTLEPGWPMSQQGWFQL